MKCAKMVGHAKTDWKQAHQLVRTELCCWRCLIDVYPRLHGGADVSAFLPSRRPPRFVRSSLSFIVSGRPPRCGLCLFPDCCECTCSAAGNYDFNDDNFASVYGCAGGFACIDPDADCVDDDDITVEMVENCGYLKSIGTHCRQETNDKMNVVCTATVLRFLGLPELAPNNRLPLLLLP